MSYATIRAERSGRVALISYDRQERRNAWNVPMYREIEHAIESANADGDIGTIVITNEGPVFCAGSDFKAAPEPVDVETGRSPTIATIAMAQDRSWLHLLARSKPVVGAIAGAAIGLGVTQTLPFDIRLAGESSSYAFPFLELSVMPELGCTSLLPRLVGWGRALHICLAAATLDARQAERIGLVTAVHPDAELRPAAIALAAKIASYPALQTRLTRELFSANAGELNHNEILRRETGAFVSMFKAQRASLRSREDPKQ